MTSYHRGDIVLVDVEFTDRSGSKLRPAVVLSTLGYNQMGRDEVIGPITSNLNTPPHLGDHRIISWERAGLLAPGMVQAKPATLDEVFIRRRIGQLMEVDLAGVEDSLAGRGEDETRRSGRAAGPAGSAPLTRDPHLLQRPAACPLRCDPRPAAWSL